jgi:EF hand
MVKKSILAILCATSVFMFGSDAISQPPGGPPPEGGRPGEGGRLGEGGPRGEGGRGGERGGPEMMMRMMPVLKALDKDGDGVISSVEIDNAVAALKTLDKNGDGKLDAEELRPDFAAMGGRGPGGPGGPGGDPAAMVERMMSQDKNGDGKLSGDEISERMQPMLERADTNKDGELDKAEIEAAVKNIPRGGPGGFGGGREGGERAGGERPRRPEAE